MRFLFDVNALIALGIKKHQFHPNVSQWALAQRNAQFLTCSITEIGFVRVVAQAPIYGLNLDQAKSLLLGMKVNRKLVLEFISDTNDISSIPSWVIRPDQITDGHRLNLAMKHGAVLATFDQGIPGAYLIP